MMRPTRRDFLATAAAGLSLPHVLHAAAPRALRAAPGEMQIAPPDVPATALWRFGDGGAPGPLLRYAQGERLSLSFRNDLPQATSVHWHGIRLPNAMDGVPDVTQPPVAPGESFDYAFDLPDAGTYWYHSHAQAVEQVERGLYGALVVDETEPPDVDADHVLVLDDWRLGPDAAIIEDFDNPMDASHAGRIGNVVTTNGQTELSLPAAPGARLRLRLVNAANARVFTLELFGMTGWTVALDGMPLTRPRPVAGRFDLAPAQRIDLIVDIGEGEGEDAPVLADIWQGESYVQVAFPRLGEAREPRAAPPLPLPPNPRMEAPEDGRPIEVAMQGGAMRGLAEARSGDETLDGRALAQRGLFWALSGDAGRPETPLFEARPGDALRLRFVNDTVWPHAMHVHGHHFHELGPDGRPGDFRDTTLVQPGSTREALMIAREPGDWLLHCHMLGHHATGMGTWFRVG